MESERLEKFANAALEKGVSTLRAGQTLYPTFVFVLTGERKNPLEATYVDGPMPTQSDVRQSILNPIRDRVAAGEIEAVIFLVAVKTAKDAAVAVLVDSAAFHLALWQNYRWVGATLEMGERHRKDDAATFRSLMGHFFPEGNFFQNTEPGSIRQVAIPVVEEEHVRRLQARKDVCVSVVCHGSEGHVNAICRSCSAAMALIEKDPLLVSMPGLRRRIISCARQSRTRNALRAGA